MQMSARNAFGARHVFDGRSHDRLAQRSSGLRMLLGPSPPGNMRRSIAPSVVGTPAPRRSALPRERFRSLAQSGPSSPSHTHPRKLVADPVELQSALKSWGTSPNLRIPPIP